MKDYQPDDFDFNKALDEISQGIAKPNILICGATGVGKSSVVNHVFGENLAKVGHGIPVTQGITNIFTIPGDWKRINQKAGKL